MDTITKKVLFTATDEQGIERNGFVDANTNSEAHQKLEENGFTDILLHNDATFNLERKDLEGLSDQELERIASLEIQSMYSTNLGVLFLQALKQNWLVMTIGLAGCAWGIYDSSVFFFVLGGIIALITPVLSLKNLLTLSQYMQLHDAYNHGQYDKALKLIKRLTPKFKEPEMAFDLVVKHASILAKAGNLDGAFELVSPWQQKLASTPGMYESRIYAIYYINEDFETLLKVAHSAYEKSDNDQTILLDLISWEARYGSADTASALLANVELHLLPPLYLPVLDWNAGLIASRNNDPDAVNLLGSAVSQMLEYGDGPVTLPLLTLMTGSYARELLRNGNNEGAAKVLQNIWPILKEHGDKELVQELTPLMEP